MAGRFNFRKASVVSALSLFVLFAPDGARSQDSLISLEVTEPTAYLVGKGIEVAAQIYTTSVQAQLERDRLATFNQLAAQISGMHSASSDIESLIRSEPIRRFYISAISLNGRVSALGQEFRGRGGAMSSAIRDEFVGRLRNLRDEAYRLAFDATPILDVSDDDGVQFLVSLRSVMVSWGILQTVESHLGTLNESAAVYLAARNEFSRISRTLNTQLNEEERLAQSRETATQQTLAAHSRTTITSPLAVALRENRRTASQCVESRSSSYERQTDVDVCIGTRERPVLMAARTDRETGRTIPQHRVYGCVRYVRETRQFRINPVYRSGAVVGGRIEQTGRSISYHSTSEPAACPILMEQFESDRDWSTIQGDWRRALAEIYSSGADAALANTRRNLIREIAGLHSALSA